MTDLERLAIARDIIHSDAASAFGDVLMKREKGYMVPKETMDMANVLDKLYKILHPHPGCEHPKWDYDMEKLKDLSKEIRASDACPGPHCQKILVGKCLPPWEG